MTRRALIVLAVLTGCSVLNRLGPRTSCDALQQGLVNACQDGIIATCVDRYRVAYEVCDDSAACASSWQVQGHFRCSQDKPIPNPPDGGTTTDAGTCDPNARCLLAATDSADVQALATDGTYVFFSDCRSVWRVPVTGGERKLLAFETAVGGCDSRASLTLDQTDVYLLRNEGTVSRIVRVPKAGGVFTVVVTSPFYLYAATVDATMLYWAEVDKLHRAPKLAPADATTIAMAPFNDQSLRLVVDDAYLYWVVGRSLYRLTKTVPGPTDPQAVTINEKIDAKTFTVDGSAVFVASPTEGTLWRVPHATMRPVQIVTGQTSLRYVASDGANAYFSVPGDRGSRVLRVRVTGGETPTPATDVLTQSDIGFLRIDDKAIYWREGFLVVRGPK